MNTINIYNSKMVRLVTSILIAILALMMNQELSATHVVGGDLTYRCLGDGNYEFSLNFRRDCFFGNPEAGFDDPAVLGIFDSNGNLLSFLGDEGGINMPFESKIRVESEANEFCAVDNATLCVDETTYTGQIKLPRRDGGYIIAYQRCCHNQTLLNIIDPLETGSTYFVEIGDRSFDECNSSPVFNNWVDIYACKDDPLVFDHSALDPDADSLVYSLCQPLAGATIDQPMPQPPFMPESPIFPFWSSVVWSNSYSTDNMFGTGVPLSIDPETGAIYAEPGTIGQFLIGVCVQEYRDGDLLGTVIREFEVNVRECGEMGTVDFDLSYLDCDNLEVELTSITDGVTLYDWTITSPNGSELVTAMTPDVQVTFPEPGTFTILLVGTNDFGCAISHEEDIEIDFVNVDPSFEITVGECNDEAIDVQLTNTTLDNTGNSEFETITWDIMVDGSPIRVSNDDNILLEDLSFSEISVTMTGTTVAGCVLNHSITATIADLLPNASFGTSLESCQNGIITIDLFDTSTFTTESPDSWSWTVTNSTGVETYMTQTITADIIDGTIVELLVGYPNGCAGFIRETFNLGDFITITEINATPVDCIVDNGVFGVILSPEFSGLADIPITYLWSYMVDGETLSSAEDNIVISIQNDQEIEVSLLVTFANGCEYAVSENIIANSLIPTVEIGILDSNCNNDGTVTSTLGYTTGGTAIVTSQTWDLMNEQGAEETITVTTDQDNDLSASLTLFLDNGCHIRITEIFESDELQGSSPEIGLIVNDCSNYNSVSITLINETEVSSVISPMSIIWNYSVDGVVGSSSDDRVDLTVPSSAVIDVLLTINYDNNCSRAVQQSGLDLGIPSIEFSNNPILSCEGNIVTLVANPNSDWTYDWEPVDGLDFDSETDFSNPSVEANEMITYVVTVTNEICSTIDSVTVIAMDDQELVVNGEREVCNGMYALSISNPISGVDYLWSDDSDFTNILFTGTEFTGSIAQDIDAVTYFVQIDGDNPQCLVGMETITIRNFNLDIEITANGQVAVDSVAICADESLTLTITNNIEDEFISWCASGDTIAFGNTLHLVPAGEDLWTIFGTMTTVSMTEIISKVSVNSFCSVSDTLSLDLFDFGPDTDNDGFSFTFEGFDCESNLACFQANTDALGTIVWSIEGDGLSLTESGSAFQCFDFSEVPTGAYTVTLTALDAPCTIIPYTEVVDIGTMGSVDVIDVIDDVVNYCVGDIVTLTGTTDINGGVISWCNANNEELAVGATYTFTPIGPMTIIAKLDGSNNCVDTTMVSVLPYDFGSGTDNEGFSFAFEGFDCESNLACFQANTDALGTIVWTIEGNGLSLTESGSAFQCFDFSGATSGIYTVTLASLDAPCTILPYTEEVDIGTMGTVGVVGVVDDVINYCVGDDVTLIGTTDINGGVISWCNANNEELAVGATYTFTPLGPTTIIAKLDGDNNCVDTTMVSVLPYDFGSGTGNESLSYTVDQANCESLEACFTPNTTAESNLIWVILGGGIAETIASNDQEFCYIFPSSGTYSVQLTAPNAPCSVSSYSETLEIYDVIPEVTIDNGSEVSFCAEGSLTLSATSNVGNENIRWCDADGNEVGRGATLDIMFTAPTTYTAKAGYIPSCSTSTTVMVGMFNVDEATLDAPAIGCEGDVVIASIEGLRDGNFSYNWSPAECISGDATSDSVVLTGQGSKDISVEITDNVTGCSSIITHSITFSEFENIGFEVIENDTIFLGGEVTLNVLNANDEWDYDWSNGEFGIGLTSISEEPKESQIYSVIITDQNGCSMVLEMLVVVLQPNCDETDIYLPNAFTPNGDSTNDIFIPRSNFIERVEFFVFDRWGEEVFFTTDVNQGWDGTFDGEALASDVYAYCLKVTCPNDEEFVKSGNVSLLR